MDSMIYNLIAKPAVKFYKRRIQKDPFQLAIASWKRDRGEALLKFNFPLNAESVVVDVGGYHGDFAYEMVKRFGCKVLIFEPMPEFYERCVKRFDGNPNVQVFQFGLGDIDQQLCLSDAKDASSFYRSGEGSESVPALIRDVQSAWDELEISEVALMKINIEGGEYPLLERLIESGLATSVHQLLVQFHDFIDNAQDERAVIQRKLDASHQQSWCYDFVWESWQRRAAA